MKDDTRAYYSKKKNNLLFVKAGLTFLFLLLMVFSFAIPLRNFITAFTENSVIVITVYSLLVCLFYVVFTGGVKYYEEFFLKTKLDLSDQSLTEWLRQAAIDETIFFSIFFVSAQMIYFLMETHSRWWWLSAAVIWVFFRIIMVKLVPEFITPLFARFLPISDEGLKKRLIFLADSVNIKIDDVYIIKREKNDPQEQTVFVDPGVKRRIVLGEGVLGYAPEEIEVMAAHELAHHYYGHVWKKLMIKGLGVVVIFFLVGVLFGPIARALGYVPVTSVATLPLLAALFFIFSFLAMPVFNMFSRDMDAEADSFALQLTKSPDAFVSVMIRISQQGFVDPNPNRFIEMFLFAEPSINKRIFMAEDYAQELTFHQKRNQTLGEGGLL
ncbi:MAG: M48 family metalloprotease [Candidatus Omnitrophota bacterium]